MAPALPKTSAAAALPPAFGSDFLGESPLLGSAGAHPATEIRPSAKFGDTCPAGQAGSGGGSGIAGTGSAEERNPLGLQLPLQFGDLHAGPFRQPGSIPLLGTIAFSPPTGAAATVSSDLESGCNQFAILRNSHSEAWPFIIRCLLRLRCGR